MKKQCISILLLPFFILLMDCERDESIKFFPPEKLSELSLDKIDDFWKSDTITSVEHPTSGLFSRDSGFYDALRYSSKNKDLTVTVFKSQEIAISTMEERRYNVACLIENGTSDEIKDTWWFTKCTGNYAVFVNKWNTIIEVGYYHENYEEIEDIVYSTANELAKRVDKLSE